MRATADSRAVSDGDVTGRVVGAILGRHRRLLVGAILVATLVLGAGAPAVDLKTSLAEFQGGTAAAEADDYVESTMSGSVPNVTRSIVIVRDDPAEGGAEENVLTRQRFVEQLRAQREMRATPAVNRTLEPAQPPLSIANVVAIIDIKREAGQSIDRIEIAPRPPLDAQIAAARNLTDNERELYTSWAVGIVLDDVDHTWPAGDGFAFVPTDYEANAKAAGASIIVLSHQDSTSPENLTAAQVTAREITAETVDEVDVLALGDGIVNAELRRSSVDSVTIVGPVAFLLVLALLVYAYRDLYDVALGVFGLAVVLVWTFGFMGWAGIDFNQVFVAVPVLLIGLSIDYAIHVFMRYREAREGRRDRVEAGADPGPRDGMGRALAGVGGALFLVTLTTATGFLSNVLSDVAPLRRFAVVSAVGIVAALVVFGALVPALKLELDEYLEARGRDRRAPAFGTEGGRLSAVLASSVATARAAPWLVVGLAVLTGLAGTVGALGIDTSFEEEDLLIDETPDWAADLPEPFAPGDYRAQEALEYVKSEGIVYTGTYTEILARGDLTEPDTLDRVQAASDAANESGVAMTFPNKNPGTRSPVTMMRTVAYDDQAFNRTFTRTDTDGDRVPDRNLTAVYDAFYEAAPVGAASMLHRVDGEYRALRIRVPVDGSVSEQRITAEIRAAAAPVRGDGLRATATGGPVKNQAVAANLLDTVSEALAVTLLVVVAGLAVAYRRTQGDWTLGVVTLLPVVLALAWILGTMRLLSIPFNVMTALITSFTIGIGIDYSIHLSERYVQELEAHGDVAAALRSSVFGTGGALLGSAVTDVSGVGVLAFAILVPLQQFGVITALTIAYSFLASVVVLPSLLVLWTAWRRPVG